MIGDHSLPGFRGTRAEVLIAVKKTQPVTAKELAVALKVTPNALRRHLKELEGEGVVAYQREVRGVGGPMFVFSLTERGEGLFPQAYDETLGEALELVREQGGEEALVAFFRRRWQSVADKAKPELEHLPLADRARRLAELLTTMGYMAESPTEGVAMLREHNCTVRAVAMRFPEICAAEKQFIQDVLGVEVTRQAHIAKGANCCEYCLGPGAHGGTGMNANIGVPLEGTLVTIGEKA